MGLNVSRTVEIEVSNKTQNFTLEKPRLHFFSGYTLTPPPLSVPPGSSSTSKFTNKTSLWGCNGILAFEAKTFTLAIYFSNPIDYNRFSVEMGLELSRDKVHKGDLRAAYERLVRSSFDSSYNSMFPSVILKENQERVQLSAGPVKVTATMSRGQSAVIKVVVENRGTVPRGRGAVGKSGKEEWGAEEEEEEEAGVETHGPGRHYQESPRPGRHYQKK